MSPEMERLVSFIILALYTLGLGFANPMQSFFPYVKINLEHTHEVASRHHHDHDSCHEDSHHHDQDNADAEHNAESTHHSHEVSIPIFSGYIVNTSNIETVSFVLPMKSISLRAHSEVPPKPRTLESIFRPPIA